LSGSPLAGESESCARVDTLGNLDGETETLEIPKGTQPETVYRLGKKGVPHLQRRGRGDLLVHVEVTVPTDLGEDEEEVLRTYAELRGERPATTKRGLFRR
jgi:molecular chaperone DnaJ